MPTTMLAVQYLDNANPVPHRRKLGDLHELTKSVRANGIVKPLLVRPDFQVIDGFRRLAVAQNLGFRDVPIKKIVTWLDLMDNLHPTESDCLPMQWLDLLDFWGNVLKPLHQEYRYVASLETRRAGRGHTKPLYSGYMTDVATIYQVQPSTVKLLRDYMVRMERNKKRFPVFTKGIVDLLPEGEAARNLSASRVLKAVFDKLVYSTDMTEPEALLLFELRLNEALNSGRPRVPRATAPLNPNQPPTPLTTVRNLTDMLEQLAAQADQFRNFRIKASDAVALNQSITASLVSVTGLRKRLNSIVQKQDSGKKAENR